MNVRYTPALVALLAGFITCVTCIVKSYDVLLSLEILLGVLIVFFIIGLMAKNIIINTLKKSDEEIEAEAKAKAEEAEKWNIAINTNEETVAQGTAEQAPSNESSSEQ